MAEWVAVKALKAFSMGLVVFVYLWGVVQAYFAGVGCFLAGGFLCVGGVNLLVGVGLIVVVLLGFAARFYLVFGSYFGSCFVGFRGWVFRLLLVWSVGGGAPGALGGMVLVACVSGVAVGGLPSSMFHCPICILVPFAAAYVCVEPSCVLAAACAMSWFSTGIGVGAAVVCDSFGA
ncbi:hypothetical protein U1Q18_041963 [Sarracenia purpurea var. burkii]